LSSNAAIGAASGSAEKSYHRRAQIFLLRESERIRLKKQEKYARAKNIFNRVSRKLLR
jgi:hypothetical protein